MPAEIRPWYRWFWFKYRTSTRVQKFSSLAVHGAYQNLLAAAWERGGDLPNDRRVLARLSLSNSQQEYDLVAEEVESMFQVSEDKELLLHDTLCEEWNTSTNFLEKKREAGRKSGEHRRNISRTQFEHNSNTTGTNAEPVAVAVHNTGGPEKPEKPPLLSKPDSDTTEDDMKKNSFADKISVISIKTLGFKAEPASYEDLWHEMKLLVDSYDQSKVLDTFQAWANSRKGETLRSPVREFLKEAYGLLAGVRSVTPEPEVVDLVNSFSILTGGDITFDAGRTAGLKRLLEDYTATEIEQAFRLFYGKIENDEFKVRNGAKTFCETASALIETIRHSERVRKDAEAQIAVLSAKRKADLAEEQKARAEKEREEKALIAEFSEI